MSKQNTQVNPCFACRQQVMARPKELVYVAPTSDTRAYARFYDLKQTVKMLQNYIISEQENGHIG